jgi:hypothetical protein
LRLVDLEKALESAAEKMLETSVVVEVDDAQVLEDLARAISR